MAEHSIHAMYQKSIKLLNEDIFPISIQSRRALHFIIALLMFINPNLSHAGMSNNPELDDESVTVRATSSLPDAAVKFLAYETIPATVVIPSHKTPEEAVGGYCGSFTETYWSIFLSMNPSLKLISTSARRTALLPTCVKWRRNPVVTTKANDTIETIIQREIGSSSNDIMQICSELDPKKRCNATFISLVQTLNPGISDSILYAGRKVSLPISTSSFTFKIRRRADLTSRDFSTKLRHIVDGSVAHANFNPLIVNRVANLVKLIEPMDSDATVCPIKAGLEDRWPFSNAEIVSVIRRNAKLIQGAPSRSIITIADTGLKGLGSHFEEIWFVKNPNAIPGSLRPLPGLLYAGDVYGINAGNRTGNIEPISYYRFPSHGTHVAEWALGGQNLRRRFRNLSRFIGIKVVNLVSAYNDSTADINEASILAAIRYAGSQMSTVVNMSIATGRKIDGLLDSLHNFPSMILVTAAGNSGADLGRYAMHPSVEGGEVDMQVITVAASDQHKEKLLFSNESMSYVDLAAPGCGLTYNESEKETLILSGTSFAAPIVSFSIAILQSFGINNPKDIKYRLYSGVDFIPNLAVRSEGVLNVLKTISIFDDLVETLSGIHRGTWLLSAEEREDLNLCTDETPVDFRSIMKISYLPESSKIRIFIKDDAGNGKFEQCKPTGEGLYFNFGANRERELVKWADMIDFVPRHFPN